MQVLVNLRFSNGDFEHGFDKTNLSASIAGSENSTELQTQLPAAPRIPELYKNWQHKYSELVETRVRKIVTEELITSGFYTGNLSRGFSKKQPTNFSYYECQQNCNQYAEDLRTQINQWLVVIKSQLETEFELDTNSNSEILLTINTENITSRVTKDILHRLPWQEWDYFDNNSTVEAVLCLSESSKSLTHTLSVTNPSLSNPSLTHTLSVTNPSVTNDGIFRRVRITSIFGDSEDIDVDGDRQLITKLQKRGAELINLEQPQRQDFTKLWDEPCDILFYSGHSESSIDGTVGSLQINSEENLNLQEIRNTFQEAIRKGLKLAIFNSCDGLGLAKQLTDLHLPYIIVWREPVPDKIAIRFLEYFLSSYSEGKSLFKSVRDARIKLVELTNSAEKSKQIPGLEWLPIICKNTTDAAPTWEDLGGLTGKLPDSPYQGLSAFGEEDKEFFFGRDDVIADLVKAVNNKPLIPVIGASGSGKSSVVFAGLVPQLRNIGNVQIVSFRPGKNPFDALAVALNKIDNIQSNNRLKELELEVDLQQNQQTLCNFIRNNYNLTSKNIPSSERFIIIADQFEELYTLTEDSLRQSFLDLLLYTVQNAPAFSLVLTLRADFMGKVLDYQPMGEAFQKYPPVLLTPMKREDLLAAIEQPAAKLKVELEQGLTSKLIDDLGNQPGRLPLLEFTLSLLWEKHDKWYLTHRAYAEIGGLEKALAKYADGVLNPLSAADKEKAERIFIQLISPGEGTEDTKRQATRGEVGEDNWDLVEFLANNRLVVTGWDETSQQETVEIVHEALIREWGVLRDWIQSNRRFRVWQERLQFEVVKWDKNRDEKNLLSGGNLGEAEGWLIDEKYRDYLSDIQGEFIRESLEKREREEKEKSRLQKRAIKWLSGGLVAASLATGFAGLNWGKAEISATQEKLNGSVAISENHFNLQNHQDALFEAIKAQQLLDKTWWKQWLPTYIEQKVKIATHQPINHSWVEEKHTLSGHKGLSIDIEVNKVVLVFSPDGKTIASTSTPWDSRVKLWNADNGKLLFTLSGDSVEFSPDGKTIASGSRDGTVKLWNADNGQLLNTTITGHKDLVTSIIFSPDGKTIASASRDGTVKLWNADNGKLLNTLSGHTGSVFSIMPGGKTIASASSIVFSPDGKTIASASRDGTVKLWNADNGELLHTITGPENRHYSVEFSPDGKTITSLSGDTIKLWNVDNGKLVHTLSGHKDLVTSVKFSPDGKTIASASWDKTLKLWNVDSGKLIHTITGHKSKVSKLVFSPDGKTIASASWDRTVKLWNADDGKLLNILSGHKNWVVSVEFSPDGKTIALASRDRTVKLWNINNGKLLNTITGHKDLVFNATFSPDGKTVASASWDKTVKLWNADNGTLLYTIPAQNSYISENSSISNIVFSPDSKTIASASQDGTVKLWNADNGKLLHTFSEPKKSVNNVVFSPDSKTIASALRNGTVKLWNADNGKLLHTIIGHQESVNNVEFSPDGKTIASASDDQTVKLWDADNGKLLHTLSGHKSSVTRVVFSSDRKTIASASWDKTVKLWNADNGKLLHTLSGHKGGVFSVTFSPDSKTIASASRDNTTVKLWNANNGKLLHTLSGHQDSINSIAFSPDSKTVVSASRDKTIKLWNTDNGKLLHTLSGHQETVWSAEFSPDGKTIVSASEDKTVKLWDWNFDDLIIRGCNRLQNYLIEHPEKLEELKVCQNPEIITAAASTFVQKGEELAKNRDYESAIENFRKAQQFDANIDLNPLTKKLDDNPEVVAAKLTAPSLVRQGGLLALTGDLEGAIENFRKAQQFDANIDLNPRTKKIDNNPNVVVEKLAGKLAALSLVSQGRLLAQTGDLEGAIEKFRKAQQVDANIDLNPLTKKLDDNPEVVAIEIKKSPNNFLVPTAPQIPPQPPQIPPKPPQIPPKLRQIPQQPRQIPQQPRQIPPQQPPKLDR
ncbi:MAG: CHAT domain-containing protein [Cyanobacteria bacterium J06643_5]